MFEDIFKRLSIFSLSIVGILFLLFSIALAFSEPFIVFFGEKEVPQQIVFFDSLVLSIFRVLVGSLAAFSVAFVLSLCIFLMFGRRCYIFLGASLILALTPPLVWSSIVIFTVGLGPFSSILTIILSTLFILMSVMIDLYLKIPKRYLSISNLYNLDLFQRVRYIIVPQISEGLFWSLRLTVVIAWIAVTTAESFGVSSGLGAMLLLGKSLFSWQAVLSSWFSIIAGAIISDVLVVSVWHRFIVNRRKDISKYM